jgi:hypothetical protein
MKFVSDMLYVLLLIMFRTYAHEREIFVKKCLTLIMAISRACMSLSILLAMLVLKLWLSCLSMSQLLACCRVLCIFEKHMLAFVDLIHALPTRGRKVPNSCFQGEFCIKERKIGRNALVQGELAFMHLGALFRLNFSCAFCRWCRALLSHLEVSAILEHFISVVSSRCPCLKGPRSF